jgi:hypothetical protein
MLKTQARHLKYTRWHDLIEVIDKAMHDVQIGTQDYFTVTFFSDDFKMNPYIAFSRAGNTALEMEIVHNDLLGLELSKWQRGCLQYFRFNERTSDNPNFIRTERLHESTGYLATVLIDAFRQVYEIDEDSWFSFGNGDYEKALVEKSSLWTDIRDPQRLCLGHTNFAHAKQWINRIIL